MSGRLPSRVDRKRILCSLLRSVASRYANRTGFELNQPLFSKWVPNCESKIMSTRIQKYKYGSVQSIIELFNDLNNILLNFELLNSELRLRQTKILQHWWRKFQAIKCVFSWKKIVSVSRNANPLYLIFISNIQYFWNINNICSDKKISYIYSQLHK